MACAGAARYASQMHFSWMLLALAAAGHEGLTWERTTVLVSAAAGQRVARAEFRFRNETPYPIRITSIEPSCHCTTAQAEPSDCPPGATGVIRAEMDIEGDAGRVEKHILVGTDANPYPSELTFDVDCPTPAARK